MNSSSRKRAIIGIILVVVGAIFLLDNLGFDIDLPWYLFRWPIIFIILGIVNLLSGNPRPALVFFAIGIFFYLHFLDILNMRDFWPVIIILAGLSFLLGRRRSKSGEFNEDFFDEISIFSGTEKSLYPKIFREAKSLAYLGVVKLTSDIPNQRRVLR